VGVIDRMEGATENIRKAGYDVDCLVNIEQLGLK